MFMLSRTCLSATPGTVAHQYPLSMEFSRQEYWSGLSFPSPEDLPNLGIIQGSSTRQADYMPSEPPRRPVLVALSSRAWHAVSTHKSVLSSWSTSLIIIISVVTTWAEVGRWGCCSKNPSLGFPHQASLMLQHIFCPCLPFSYLLDL